MHTNFVKRIRPLEFHFDKYILLKSLRGKIVTSSNFCEEKKMRNLLITLINGYNSIL